MQQSSIYKALEAMIEKNWLVKSPSEFDQLLAQLEKARQITREEYRSLLELFLRKSTKIN
jgi:DNA-binding MarR family transcriptional regulator